MRKYYVMASFQNEAFPIHSLIEYPEVEFKDLTYIDLYTIHKTKEEFFEEIKDMNPTLKSHQLEELDFFIARTTYNQKDKKHRIRFYDCIFKSNDLENKTETKILMNLEKLALERSKNVTEKKTIELKETTNFLEFASYLIDIGTHEVRDIYKTLYNKHPKVTIEILWELNSSSCKTVLANTKEILSILQFIDQDECWKVEIKELYEANPFGDIISYDWHNLIISIFGDTL